jgi:hypothetical protein
MNNKEYFSQFDDEKRWEALREYYGKSPKGSTSMARLAQECGSSWFDSRADDTPEQFIQHSWYRMINLRGFGKKKIELLLSILVASVDFEEFINGVPAIQEPEEPPQLEIEGWDRFPLELSFCVARTKSLFENVSLKTPSDLVAWYEEFGEKGVLGQGNTGRKTLTEIQQIYGGWKQCDLTRLQALLPIDEQLHFTLHDSILGHYSRLSDDYQAVLCLRLVEQHTLEECGSTLKKTRERIRQIEKLLLTNVELALDYFAEERDALFEEWQATGDISCVETLSEEHRQLFRGAIRNHFERSDEGKETIAQNQQEIESAVHAIREQWDYYTGGLRLNEYLEGEGLIAHKERILEAGNSKGYFSYDAATDRLTPTKALLKHAALACLKSSEREEWSGAEWLQKLKESPRFAEVDFAHLSHLYRNWKNDSDFQEFSIDFSREDSMSAIEELEEEIVADDTTDEAEPETPEARDPEQTEAINPPDRLQMIRDAVKAPIEETPKPTAIPKPAPEFEEDADAKAFDLLIRSAIEEAQSLSSEDALLGFLNVSDDDQQQILSIFREALSEQKAATLIRRYPALASYALTLAAAVGLQQSDIGSGSFYLAWDFSIGWSPPPTSRKQIARSYLAALKHLDLRVGSIFPDQTLDWKGGCYLFHAAVLPHFIPPLEAALKSVQRELPLPDPDEPRQIEQFARLLANRVERGQRRLIAVLESPVGSFLVRRLVLWHMTGDSDLFPPFILKMLEEQKSTGQETIIKRPYIIFDSLEEALFLELPAQSGKITNPNSKWLVNGRPFRADTIREPIRLSDIVSSEIAELTVEIEGLLRKSNGGSFELRKQSYSFKTGLEQDQAFRIFRESDGREVPFQIRHGQIELGLGAKYVALLAEDIEIESDHESDECELGQIVEFEANIDSQPLVVNDGENEWTIKPKITPGTFVHRKDAQSFTAKDLISDKDVSINYGSDFGLTVALPSGAQSASVVVESMTAGASSHRENVVNTTTEDPLTLTDLSASFSSWLSSLTPAMHEVEILLTPDGRKPLRQTFWYWKGLNYVTQSGDMYLEDFPQNLKASGYEYRDGRLEYVTGSKRCAEFSSNQSEAFKDFRLKIPKPGVDVTISNNEGEIMETNPPQAIDILPSDTRIITFTHGGLAPIELRSGDTLIGQVDTERRSLTRSLGALVSNLGKTGSINAHTIIPFIEDAPRRVIHWRTPKVVKHCNAIENEDGEYHWELTGLSSVGLKGIKARLYDVAELTEAATPTNIVEIDLPEHVEHRTETTIIEGLQIEVSMNFNDCYRFIFHYDRHKFLGQIHVLEMDCLIADGSGWQQLACNEGHGRLSDLRLIFKGHKPETTSEDNPVQHVFWNDLNTIGFGHGLDMSIADPEILERWLARARWLVNYRYPKIVWEKYSIRLKAFYRAVTRLAVDNGGTAYWWQNATAGLEEHAARKSQNATIAPCLLFGAAYAGLFPGLDDTVEEELSGDGLITKCLAESSRVMGAQSGALNYVQSAFESGRVEPNFFGYFSTWQDLLQMKDVPLKGFSLLDWGSKLSAQVRRASFDDIKDEFALLEPDHYVECIRKLSERSHALDSIRSQETSHWLSPYISQLNQIAGHTTGILRQVTGKPHEELWESFESSELLLLEEELRGLVTNIIKACCVLASVYASVNKGLISAMKAQKILDLEFGTEPNRAETLRFLIIGTAPELIAYLFLFFTFTLEPSPER